MKRFDQHFTPPELARQVVAAISTDTVEQIADFAVGEGHLLKEVATAWPNAKLYGVDIDHEVIRKARRNVSGTWESGDFLEARFYRKHLSKYRSYFDVIVLNPPFSIRGIGRKSEEFLEAKVTCSSALAFIIRAIPFLRKDGLLVAIVPHGLLHGEKDQLVVQLLKTHFGFKVINDSIYNQFDGCDIRCSLIRIENSPPVVVPVSPLSVMANNSVFRGAIDHTKYRGKRSRAKSVRTIVHTTNLRDGIIFGQFAILAEKICGKARHSGTLVLVPRVGRVKEGKIVVLDQAHLYDFTSCVICIACKSVAHGEVIRVAILKNWSKYLNCYGGTGAPYTTITKISTFLASISEPESQQLGRKVTKGEG